MAEVSITVKYRAGEYQRLRNELDDLLRRLSESYQSCPSRDKPKMSERITALRELREKLG